MLSTYLGYFKVALLVVVFMAGYYLRGIQVKASDDKLAHAEIKATADKMLSDNRIDADYNKQLMIIDTVADNSKIGASHEKDASCVIPAAWVRQLHSESR